MKIFTRSVPFGMIPIKKEIRTVDILGPIYTRQEAVKESSMLGHWEDTQCRQRL